MQKLTRSKCSATGLFTSFGLSLLHHFGLCMPHAHTSRAVPLIDRPRQKYMPASGSSMHRQVLQTIAALMVLRGARGCGFTNFAELPSIVRCYVQSILLAILLYTTKYSPGSSVTSCGLVMTSCVDPQEAMCCEGTAAADCSAGFPYALPLPGPPPSKNRKRYRPCVGGVWRLQRHLHF